jgi:hypothetical protein
MRESCKGYEPALGSRGMTKRKTPPPDRQDPGSWPSFLAWLGREPLVVWLKITAFAVLVILAARLTVWF